ncbi:MAG: hypothetical protein H6861_02825 [Rhodospirillales bacterium]|nr:hypothetical protein [Rhodospirillales bacterium]
MIIWLARIGNAGFALWIFIELVLNEGPPNDVEGWLFVLALLFVPVISLIALAKTDVKLGISDVWPFYNV